MTAPLRKTPPPPPIAVNDPVFNHWLHDLTAFIAEGGGIDTGTIPGYDALVSTVNTHTTEITTNTSNISTNTSNISTNTSNISINTSNISTLSSTSATHTSQINANTSNISALTARSQVLNGTAVPAVGLGINGDWFADTAARHIYVKTGGSWVLIV